MTVSCHTQPSGFHPNVSDLGMLVHDFWKIFGDSDGVLKGGEYLFSRAVYYGLMVFCFLENIQTNKQNKKKYGPIHCAKIFLNVHYSVIL